MKDQEASSGSSIPTITTSNPPLFSSAPTLEEQMLDALEIFKYSFSFRDSLFVVYINNRLSLKKLMYDFQLIQSSRIFLLVLTPDFEYLKSEIDSYRSKGVPIEYFSQKSDKEISNNRKKIIKKELSSHDVVVLEIESSQSKTSQLKSALKIAELYKAKKFFYVHDEPFLSHNNESISHISLSDLKKKWNTSNRTFNVKDELLSSVIEDLETTKREFIFIDDSPGALYQEIFTHQGRGTLVTDEYPNNIRSGKSSDVFMVRRMMKPYITNGILLPMSEEELQLQIQDFLLYTINEAIIAGARMIEYGEGIELAKFFCLPRFRRRGHARALAEKFIETAKNMKKDYIFSLSITPGMWDFLQSLGFKEVERESLPETWKANYNFERQSKAFMLTLK